MSSDDHLKYATGIVRVEEGLKLVVAQLRDHSREARDREQREHDSDITRARSDAALAANLSNLASDVDELRDRIVRLERRRSSGSGPTTSATLAPRFKEDESVARSKETSARTGLWIALTTLVTTLVAIAAIYFGIK